MTLLILVFTLLVAIFFAVFVWLKPNYVISMMIVSSIITSSMILLSKYPAVDELIWAMMSIVAISKILFNRKNLEFRRLLEWKRLLVLILILFLLLNTLVSAALNFHLANLRFITLYSSIAVLFAFTNLYEQEIKKAANFFKVSFTIHNFFWVGNWYILTVLGLDWNLQQSINWAGSSYAALVPSASLFVMLYLSKLEKKPISISFWISYIVLIIASQIYDSRVMEFTIILVTVTIFFWFMSVGNLVTVLTFGILALSLSNVSVSYYDRNFTTYTNAKVNLVKSLEVLTESSTFLTSPRRTDRDRNVQIECANRIMLSFDRPFNSIFGFGQDNHKTILWDCVISSFLSNNGSGIIRPVGYAAFLIDFGLVGLTLFGGVVVFLLLALPRKPFLSRIILLYLLSWALLTNNLDHTFFYLVVVFGMLIIESKDFSKSKAVQ